MKVLVVDDDPHVLDALSTLLAAFDFDPHTAIDCGSAEERLASEFFPVILADLRLRSVDQGMQLLESIRRMSPRSCVASMSGVFTPELETRVRELGARIVLQKPFEAAELIDAIHDMTAAVEHAGGGDLDAVYRSTIATLRKIACRRYGFTAHDADELVQEAWCLFLKKRRSVRMPHAWLSGAIANLCRREIGRRMRDRARNGAMPAIGFASGDDDVLAVRQGMARLDSRSRELCSLIGLERRSYAEVSAATGLPIGSVGPLFIRAKQKLRRLMEL